MSRRHEQIQTDMRRLRSMLDRVLTNDEARAHPDGAPARILDVACGACHEAETLADYFGELKDGAPAVELTGIDVRAREIADAQRRFTPRDPASRKFEFLNGDATKLDDHRELGDNFDVVFFRHQNLWNGRRTWEEIFDKALHKLDDDGQLIITSYFDREHHLALEAIQRLGGELIATEYNSDSRELPTAGKSIDRHVAVFRKKQV
jgi:SAM-dependent methyltransferase